MEQLVHSCASDQSRTRFHLVVGRVIEQITRAGQDSAEDIAEPRRLAVGLETGRAAGLDLRNRVGEV